MNEFFILLESTEEMLAIVEKNVKNINSNNPTKTLVKKLTPIVEKSKTIANELNKHKEKILESLFEASLLRGKKIYSFKNGRMYVGINSPTEIEINKDTSSVKDVVERDGINGVSFDTLCEEIIDHLESYLKNVQEYQKREAESVREILKKIAGLNVNE